MCQGNGKVIAAHPFVLCYSIILIISYLIEKKDGTYNSVNDSEIFTLEIKLLAPVVWKMMCCFS